MKEPHLRFRFHAPELILMVLVFILPLCATAQVSVRVMDTYELPLIGALVSYEDTSLTTDENGVAVLPESIPDTTSVRFSYITYKDLVLTFGQIRKQDYVVKLKNSKALLEEVVIVGRTNTQSFDIPYAIRRIDDEEIFSSNAQTTVDALNAQGAAYIQKSQMGGGSPILRGFESNKILLVVDGVRMNNAIYRNGHLQNAITVDPAILSQIELIYGPGSLMYGSDALGGVIHFRTKSPLSLLDAPRKSDQEINSYIRYNSANQERSFHLDHQFQNETYGVLTSVTYSHFDDLRAGSNRPSEYPFFGLRNEYAARIDGRDTVLINPRPDVQLGSAYQQLDIMQKWAYRIDKNILAELNLQLSTSGDIPRYDLLTEKDNGLFTYAEWYYGPQKRLLISPRLTWYSDNTFFDQLLAIASFQDISEQRNIRLFGNDFREIQDEDLSVFGLTIDLQKKINANQSLTYGLDLHYNDLESTAFRQNINDGRRDNNVLTRYPDGSNDLKILGAYLQHTWENTDSTLNWINGLRISHQNTNFNYESRDPVEWPPYFYEGVSNKNNTVVVTTGLNIKYDHFLAKISTGTAFRSPNIDDLAKIRINNDEITVPNPELDSEKVWNSEININYHTAAVDIGLSAYYTRLHDAIIRQPFTLPDGRTNYITAGDTLTVVANVNAETGSIKGFSTWLHWNVTPNLDVHSSFNIQEGTATTNEGTTSPLGHIPPTYGQARISYGYMGKSISFGWQFNLWKNIGDFGGSVDNPDLATPDGTPAWHVFDLQARWQVNRNWLISAGLYNLFDLHYRPFSSGISAPGRHVAVALKYSHN